MYAYEVNMNSNHKPPSKGREPIGSNCVFCNYRFYQVVQCMKNRELGQTVKVNSKFKLIGKIVHLANKR